VAPCGRRQRASACPPRCRDEQGARIGAPAACQEQRHGQGAPQSSPPPSVNRPSRAVRCERRQRTRACLPRCRDEQGALIGARAACQELGHGPGAPQTPPPPSVNRVSWTIRCERTQRARACPPRCSAELGTPIGEPAACKERGRRPHAPQSPPPPSDDRPSSAVRCGPRQRTSACTPRCRDEQGARIGAPASCQEQGHGLGAPQSPPRPSFNRPRRAVRCDRPQRARACPPRCSAELLTPIGEPAACKRARATAARTAFTPAAERRPPESGGQLRAAPARKGLPA